MAKNVLITGPPGIGKTSLIRRLHRDLRPLIIKGFVKEEIVEYDLCRGYRIVTFDYQEIVLAHRYLEGPDRVNAFGLNIEGFERLVIPELRIDKGVELFLIDEIGVMECRSARFCKSVITLLDSAIPVIATVSSFGLPEQMKLKEHNDVTILQMDRKNRDSVWKNVLLAIT